MHGMAPGANNRMEEGASVNPDKCTRLTASDGRVKKRVEFLLVVKYLGWQRKRRNERCRQTSYMSELIYGLPIGGQVAYYGHPIGPGGTEWE